MRRLNLAQEIIHPNRTMHRPFWEYLQEVERDARSFIPQPYENNADATYTLELGDANTVIRFTAVSPAVTIPTAAAVEYELGDVVTIRQAGTGTLVLTTTGLTINGTVPTWAQNVEVSFRKVGTNTWDVM